MDTELLRTFLEVRKTRHFARAAANLFVTQAAVSARIRQLEDLIGQRLLTRDRNNIQLTSAGRQLAPYAEAVLETWSRALLEVTAGDLPLITIGCLPSLREVYLDDWVLSLLAQPADRRLGLESLNTLETITRVRDRSLDLGVVYEAPRAPDLWVEELTRFELELVSTGPASSLEAGLEDYVHVDWGTSLTAAQDARPPGIAGTRARLDSALLARRQLLTQGGCAYLPGPLVADDLAAGRLYLVADSPKPRRTVFLIGAAERREVAAVDALIAALKGLAARADPG